MNRKIIFVIFLSIFFTIAGNSQIEYSPYSMFGVGQVENTGFGAYKALGGTGIAFSSQNALNNINPASYDGIDSLNFLYEFGLSLNLTTYDFNKESLTRNDGNIQYLAIGLRPTRLWALSLGMMPYSKVDYIISSTDQINGETTIYDKTFTGDGGINKFYIGNSFRLKENLVIGVNFSMLFGTITKTETAEQAYDFLGYNVERIQKIVCPSIEFGIQYSINFRDDRLTLGAIYAQHKELLTISMLKVSTPDVNYTEFDDIEDTDQFEIPQKIGFGLAYKRSNKWRFGIDYERRNWKSIEFENPLLQTRNSDRFSVGVELFPKEDNYKGAGKLHYRLGANYNKSYLEVDNIPINSFAITAGIGFKAKNQLSMINLSFEYGQNGSTQKGLIKEKYWQINLSLSLREIWFQRRQYY